MTLKSITVKSAHLLAMSLLCAKVDERHYLKHVMVDAHDINAPRIVASDGAQIGIIDASSYDESHAPRVPFDVLIPVDVIKKAVSKRDEFTRIAFRRGTWRIESGDSITAFKDYEGTRICWRDILPKLPACGEVCTIDYRRLAIFENVGKLLGITPQMRMQRVAVSFNGSGPAFITFPGAGYFFGQLMPLRTDHPTGAMHIPDWINESKKVVK